MKRIALLAAGAIALASAGSTLWSLQAATPAATKIAKARADFPISARAASDGEAAFLARCQYCHVEMGPGTITLEKRLGKGQGLLAQRTDLTRDYVKAVVRNGLNTMPALTRVEVSDIELDEIAKYLARNNKDDQSGAK